MEEDDNSVTMVDVLKEQEAFEENAKAVLGASDDKNCTYPMGYVKRQALYACLTCCPDSSDQAGVCLACSLACHESHTLIELYTKRNFRCDCGGPKFKSKSCTFVTQKSEANVQNLYNQNFSGLYCICHRPYPDPEDTVEDEMIQCVVCEDWFHSRHLENKLPPPDQYSEMICQMCMEKNEFLDNYLCYEVSMEKDTELDSSVDLNVTDANNESVQTNNETINESSCENVLAPSQEENITAENQMLSTNEVTSAENNHETTPESGGTLQNSSTEIADPYIPENDKIERSDNTADCGNAESTIESKTLLDENSPLVKPNETTDNEPEIQLTGEIPMEVDNVIGVAEEQDTSGIESQKVNSETSNGNQTENVDIPNDDKMSKCNEANESQMEDVDMEKDFIPETIDESEKLNSLEKQNALTNENIDINNRSEADALNSEENSNLLEIVPESLKTQNIEESAENKEQREATNNSTSDFENNILTEDSISTKILLPLDVKSDNGINLPQSEDVEMEDNAVNEIKTVNNAVEELHGLHKKDEASPNEDISENPDANEHTEIQEDPKSNEENISNIKDDCVVINKEASGSSGKDVEEIDANDSSEITENGTSNLNIVTPIHESNSESENSEQIIADNLVPSIVESSESPTITNLEPIESLEPTTMEYSEPILESSEPIPESSEPILENSEPAAKENSELVTKENSEPAAMENLEPILTNNSELDAKENSEPTAMENSESAIIENSEPAIIENSEPVIMENSEPAIMENSEPVIMENSEPAITENSEPAITENSEPAITENSEPAITENSEPAITENSEPAITENSEPGIVENTEPAIVEDSEPAIMENSEPGIVENSEPAIVENSEPAIMENLEPNNTENLVSNITDNSELHDGTVNIIAPNENDSINLDDKQKCNEEKMEEEISVGNLESHTENLESTMAKSSSEFPSNNENQSSDNKKRKYEDEIASECVLKKIKKEVQVCSKPATCQRLRRKGAVFWPSDWRSKLCSCPPCLDLYTEKNVLFLIDVEDTVSAYEDLGKIKTETSSSQYEKGMEALSSLGHVQQINAITEYNKMKEKLLDFLKTFKDKKEVVKEEDIKGFFAGMKPKREPDGVYFCQ